MNITRYRVVKRGDARRRYLCEGFEALYDLAFRLSVKHRAAVYFDEDATEDELIEDLNGNGYRVEILED